ncbi:MAG: MAPEG family protein [Proteobacteria bacterium]|nr:MAPEG family protein [Pseudomonadota bacterium]
MTTPFWCLLVAVLIPYGLAGLGGYHKHRQFGSVDNRSPREQAASLTGTGARVVAAQKNAWEALPVFGAAVLVAHAAGADPRLSAVAAVVFVIARVLHAGFYVGDLAPLRSLAFLVAFGCSLWLFGLAAVASSSP